MPEIKFKPLKATEPIVTKRVIYIMPYADGYRRTKCEIMKYNHLKCEKELIAKVVSASGQEASVEDLQLVGGRYLCHEHLALLVHRSRLENFKVERYEPNTTS